MFVLDNNFILDIVTRRSSNSSQYAKILAHLVQGGQCAVSSSSLHNLEYVLQKNYSDDLGTFRKLLSVSQIVKTPAYVDTDCELARVDMEDYLIELSARSVGGHVITSDRVFLKNSGLAIHPDDYFDLVRKKPQTVPFCDLKTQYQRIRPQVEKNMDGVLSHGQYIMGPEVAELEDKLCDYTGAKHCITVASGTEALLISLMALGIGPGDEVITTPFTFVATAEVIVLLGATPVFVDVEPDTCNIDASKIEAAITDKTRAIIPVSLYGQPADMDEINEIAERRSLDASRLSPATTDQRPITVIEDAAQSFGATYKGRKSCNLSRIACTSFFPSKPLGCYGDGGAIFTSDDAIAQACREIRVHGQSRRYVHTRIGVGGRMDTLQCAVVLAKLERFDWEVKRRLEIGARYNALMDERGITRVQQRPDRTSVFAQYTVFVENRAEAQKRLAEGSSQSTTSDQRQVTSDHRSVISDQRPPIPTAVHYPIPLNEQPAYREVSVGNTPIAMRIAGQVMSLPMSAELGDEDQLAIAGSLGGGNA